jgi:hypothetical protein
MISTKHQWTRQARVSYIAHEEPQQRAIWDPHAVDGWYLGPAPDHYRCYRVHINKTKANRIVDTVELFPAKVNMPRTAS